MKLIAISIIVLAGAIMAAAGTLAESMPDAKRYSIVDECGLGVVAVGIVIFLFASDKGGSDYGEELEL